jgi:hypothetical protein
MYESIIQDYRHELTWFQVDIDQIRLDFGAVKVDIYGDAEIIETDGRSIESTACGNTKAIAFASGFAKLPPFAGHLTR